MLHVNATLVDRVDLASPLSLSSQSAIGLSALAPAQRAGAQRLCALALRYILRRRANLVGNGVKRKSTHGRPLRKAFRLDANPKIEPWEIEWVGTLFDAAVSGWAVCGNRPVKGEGPETKARSGSIGPFDLDQRSALADLLACPHELE